MSSYLQEAYCVFTFAAKRIYSLLMFVDEETVASTAAKLPAKSRLCLSASKICSLKSTLLPSSSNSGTGISVLRLPSFFN